MFQVGGAPEGVDGLGVIPHYQDPPVPFGQVVGDVCLHDVRVLELVYHHILIRSGKLITDITVFQKDLQVKEEIVVVQALGRDLVLHILLPERLYLVEVLIEARDSTSQARPRSLISLLRAMLRIFLSISFLGRLFSLA